MTEKSSVLNDCPFPSPPPRVGSARALVGDDVDPPARKRPKKIGDGYGPTRCAKLLEEARILVKGGAKNASKMSPSHFVAVYASCHEGVYGVRAIELDKGKAYALASIAAARLIRDEFSGSRERMLEFLLWTWTRERKFEEFRRAGDGNGKRMKWQVQFSASLVTDFNLDKARKGKR